MYERRQQCVCVLVRLVYLPVCVLVSWPVPLLLLFLCCVVLLAEFKYTHTRTHEHTQIDRVQQGNAPE